MVGRPECFLERGRISFQYIDNHRGSYALHFCKVPNISWGFEAVWVHLFVWGGFDGWCFEDWICELRDFYVTL